MKVYYIYNPHDANEVALMERAKTELQSYVEEVVVEDFMVAKERFHITQTPALVVIREDMQGAHLLTEDLESGKLRVALEAYKVLQEEEAVIHNMETARIDNVVNAEIATRYGAERTTYEETIDTLLVDMFGGVS